MGVEKGLVEDEDLNISSKNPIETDVLGGLARTCENDRFVELFVANPFITGIMRLHDKHKEKRRSDDCNPLNIIFLSVSIHTFYLVIKNKRGVEEAEWYFVSIPW